ncbi:hypothetical protein K492DRAFT_209120 [Lichtheimia hyalospora FSU 10163]|nr:hypothetical protein K492DRAFT_209120 [Lichtheimia hyalospora FSU 10163]
MSEKYKSLKVKELQEILQKNGLPVSGKKEELIDRLVKHDESKALESLDDLAGLEEFEESKLDLDSLDPDLKSLNDKPEVAEKPKEEPSKAEDKVTAAPPTSKADTTSNEKPATEQSTTTAATEEDVKDEPAKEVVKPGSSFKYTPITFAKKPSTTTTSPSPKPLPKATAAAASKNDDIEKKLERAKRFNVPLDEKTKQQMRAERFGSGKKATSSSGVDPEVLKRRAERFGIVTKEAEDEKKRKRAERFGIPEKKQKR